MNAKNILETIGGFLFGGAILAIGILVVFVFIYGSAWASAKLLPWFSIFTWIAIGLVVFVFLPLAIPKATRGFASAAILISSYVFGATLWMESFLLSMILWGFWAVLIGIFLAGVGVVPIAMLATLFNKMWIDLIELILLTIATYGCRFGALSLAGSIEV
jgi:hypothetical protein